MMITISSLNFVRLTSQVHEGLLASLAALYDIRPFQPSHTPSEKLRR